MEIRQFRRDRSVVVALAGRLDMASAPQLEEQIEALAARGDRRVALDATGLEYLSSAGLRAILVGAKRLREAGGSLVLLGLTGTVKEVFAMSGLAGVLDTYASDRELLVARPEWG